MEEPVFNAKVSLMWLVVEDGKEIEFSTSGTVDTSVPWFVSNHILCDK